MGPRVRELLKKYIYREVSGGMVVGGEGSYLVVSGLCEVNSFRSIEGCRFWLEEVIRVGVDFLELELRVLLILRGSDPSWSLTNVSLKLLYFPFLPRSGGFDASQP